MDQMLDFDLIDPLPTQQPAPSAPASIEVVVPLVEIQTSTGGSRSHLATTSAEGWGWEQVRDYVFEQLTSRFGPQPRDAAKEAAVFKRFCNDWGTRAGQIARIAFDTYGGLWRGAPISVGRFSRASDPYFASVIARDHGLG